MALTITSGRKKTIIKSPKKVALIEDVMTATPKQIDAVLSHKPLMGQQQSETEVLVDELVSLDLKMRELQVAEMTKRVKVIKDHLQSLAKDLPTNEQAVFVGALGQVVLSPCARSTEIQNPLSLLAYLTEKFGEVAAASVVKIGLTDLKKLLSENEISNFAETVAGARTAKVIPAP